MTQEAPTRTRGRPTKREADELFDHIVDVALLAFSERGFEATTIEGIAQACKTSKHTLYRRFPTKEALFAAAVSRDRQRILGRFAAIDVSGRDTMSALRDACFALFEIAVSPGNTDLYRMCIAAVPKFPMIGLQFAESEERIQDILRAHVEKAQAEGLLAQQDPRQLSVHLYYSVIGEIWGHALLGLPYVQDFARRKAVFEANWSMFLDGSRAPRPK